MKSKKLLFVIPVVVIIGALAFWHFHKKTKAVFEDNVGSAQHISGTVTAIKYDCQPSQTLAKDGTVTTSAEATCDAGDFITINDTLIQTASGNVPLEKQFSKTLPGIKPGAKISATYVNLGQVYNSLNCTSCKLTLE